MLPKWVHERKGREEEEEEGVGGEGKRRRKGEVGGKWEFFFFRLELL